LSLLLYFDIAIYPNVSLTHPRERKREYLHTNYLSHPLTSFSKRIARYSTSRPLSKAIGAISNNNLPNPPEPYLFPILLARSLTHFSAYQTYLNLHTQTQHIPSHPFTHISPLRPNNDVSVPLPQYNSNKPFVLYTYAWASV
jgi:hypothetical protein